MTWQSIVKILFMLPFYQCLLEEYGEQRKTNPKKKLKIKEKKLSKFH